LLLDVDDATTRYGYSDHTIRKIRWWELMQADVWVPLLYALVVNLRFEPDSPLDY